MRRAIVRRLPAIFTVAVVVFFVIGAYTLGTVIERQQDFAAELERRTEIRSYLLCQSQNETRRALKLVLDALAAPREDDEPGEYEERQRLRETMDEYVQPQECPTPPEEP